MRTNRVFVPGVHASPRRSEMEEEEEEEKKEEKKRRARKNNFTKGRGLSGAIRQTARWI